MYVTQILHCNVKVLWAGGLQLQNKIFVLYCIVDTFNICMKKFGLEKIFFDKMTAVRT